MCSISPAPKGDARRSTSVLDGPADASKMLIVLSGVHGVEGFCGSAIQTGMLGLGAAPAHPDTAVLHVHAVNPYGFSHLRRVTQENVDLNRNFVDFASCRCRSMPATPRSTSGYCRANGRPAPPPKPASLAIGDRHGARGLQRAIGLGQHTHPDGMFFGGRAPTWSNRHVPLRSCRATRAPVRQLASIDIHTGLGPHGVGERIFASFDPDVLAARTGAGGAN